MGVRRAAPAVEDGAVHVAHHRADVARGVLVLLAPVDVVEDGEVPVGRVALRAGAGAGSASGSAPGRGP